MYIYTERKRETERETRPEQPLKKLYIISSNPHEDTKRKQRNENQRKQTMQTIKRQILALI